MFYREFLIPTQTKNIGFKNPLLRILCCSVPYLVCGFCARKSFLPKVEDDSVKGQQKCNGHTKTLSQTQDFQFNRKFGHAQIHKTFFLTFLPQSSLKNSVFHILNDCWIEVIFTLNFSILTCNYSFWNYGMWTLLDCHEPEN